MTEQERYGKVDMPFYRERIAPVLPPRLLDFHAHAWRDEHWLKAPASPDVAGSRYVVTEADYGVEALLAHGRRLFPDRSFNAVVFGQPTPMARTQMNNTYLAVPRAGLFPLMIVGRGLMPRAQLEEQILGGGFFGYKVFLNWCGNDYGRITPEDMIGPDEMALANELALVVLWHVPGARRLADPVIRRSVLGHAERYPNAQIVLAHCGRCYHPDEMKQAAPALRDAPNLYLDTAMVMDPLVLEMLLETVEARRVLFATDLPVAAMRGRRVNVMDHWVDLVLEGYPESSSRVASNNMRATFMAYEIVRAIEQAAARVGFSQEQLQGLFHDNGMAVLARVMKGEVLRRHSCAP